jgi:formylglycine-generating enzyme required for sulfatase activity
MSDFDPYHIWLGIPETERPISKYRLLGIGDFEDNRDVISAAAERQTIYLRTLQAGEHSVLVAQLLNEVSQARVCLLDGKSKSRYDTQLRSDLEPAPEQDPLAFAADELAAVVSKPATRSRQRSRGGKPVWKEPWAIPAGAGGIVVLLLLLMMLFGSGEEPQESGQGQEQELRAEIASLKQKLLTAGNNKVVSTASDVAAKSGPAINEALPAKAATPPLAVAPFDAARAKQHQQAWADHLGVPVVTTNSIGMKLALIPPGEFMMGSDEFEENEKPVHKVTLTRPFQLGVYEVTQEQYEKVVGDNPSKFKGPANPVEANWPDAVAFCSLLTDRPEEKLAGRRYRLPTEAEWEYSCRAGTTTAFSFGSDASLLTEFAWIARNSGGRTHPVGEKKPNAWGLYDMHGNVWERCMDWKGNYPSKDLVNPQGPSDVTIRMTRGGGLGDGNRLRSATRGGDSHSSNRSSHNGFRVVCVFSGQQEGAASVNATDAVELDQKSAIPADAIQFGGHHYQIVTDKVSWHLARNLAEEAGGHLVRINSLAEQHFLRAVLSKNSSLLGTGFYIDGTREVDLRRYVFSDGSEADISKMLTRTFQGRDEVVLSCFLYEDGKLLVNDAVGWTPSPFIIEWDDDEQTTTVSPRSSLPASLQQGLIAYYPFNGNANDESGNGHHGTVHGATLTQDRHDTANRAYLFNEGAEASNVVVPDHDLLDLGNSSNKEITISLWCSLPKHKAAALIVKGKVHSPVTDYCLYFPSTTAEQNIMFWGTGPSDTHSGSWPPTYLPNLSTEWHHLVAIYKQGKGIDGYKKVYLDDQLIYLGPSGAKNKPNSGDLVIGGGPWTAKQKYLGHRVDDVRIYDRALSATEVKALYDFEKP